MARSKRLKLTPHSAGSSQGVWRVVDRQTKQAYAILYLQNSGGYRFRLDNYSHRLSKEYTSESLALSAIESEVF